MKNELFTPIRIGDLELPNRIIMAPMTRARAGGRAVPTEIMATYYAQRASAGLVITEATAISEQGYGWKSSPGIWTSAQEEGWKNVTGKVHEAGGRIFLQLWHMGRVTHPDFYGIQPVAPSAIAVNRTSVTLGKPYVTPHALSKDEISLITDDYVAAATRAIRAGFDGVEVHAANGYLLHQFLEDGPNKRDDIYGGSIENRARLLMEVTNAVCAVAGKGKVGARISPRYTISDMSESNPAALYSYVAAELNKIGITYLHVREQRKGNFIVDDGQFITPDLAKKFPGMLIANGGYDKDTGNEMVGSGAATAIAYGKLYIANPDLVERFRLGLQLSEPFEGDKHFYSGTETGYTDYPTYSLQRLGWVNR